MTQDAFGDRIIWAKYDVNEPAHKRLRVSVHRSARPATDKRLQKLFIELNAAQIAYPGTDLCMHDELVTETSANEKMVSE